MYDIMYFCIIYNKRRQKLGFEKITSVLKIILSQLAIILHATVAKFYLPASMHLQINI